MAVTETHRLVPHPAHPPRTVTSVRASITGFDAQALRVRWRIDGAQGLVAPRFAGRGRADDLWRTTCFELFVREGAGPAYIEFNLSPSERWNAYRFAAYRDGQDEFALPQEPVCALRQGSDFAIFDAAIPAAPVFREGAAAGLTAVIEEAGGVISYWALAHAYPDKPDFHDPACFTIELPAPPPA